MPDELGRGPMYTGISSTRNADAQIQWAAVGIFLTLQSGLCLIGLPLILRIETKSSATIILVLSGAALFGAILSLALLAINRRTRTRNEFWDSVLEALETTDPHPSVRVYGSQQLAQVNLIESMPNKILDSLARILFGIWSILFLGSFILALIVH